MAEPRTYVRDGAEIYRRSFAIIRAEADLARFNAAEERVVVRLIHACGMTEVTRDVVMSPDFAARARTALVGGAPILCDSKMVANGITRATKDFRRAESRAFANCSRPVLEGATMKKRALTVSFPLASPESRWRRTKS